MQLILCVLRILQEDPVSVMSGRTVLRMHQEDLVSKTPCPTVLNMLREEPYLEDVVLYKNASRGAYFEDALGVWSKS